MMRRSARADDDNGPYGCAVESLGLAPRQWEVLYYLCKGLPDKAIANRMDISGGFLLWILRQRSQGGQSDAVPMSQL